MYMGKKLSMNLKKNVICIKCIIKHITFNTFNINIREH